LLWGLYAFSFVITKPLQTGSHDFVGHVEYTQILIHEHRLPRPYETLETQHPPLYYLLNSLFRFPLPAHINTVRALSVVYGLIFIGLLAKTLARVTKRPLFVFLSILFIITTPKFIFLFSSYNNDSLVTLLSAAFIYAWWSAIDDSQNHPYVFLLLLGSLAIYTKLTFAFAMAAAALLALILTVKKSIRPSVLGRLALIQVGVLVIILPWLALHNFRHTGHWIIHDPLRPEAHLYKSPLLTLLTPPSLAAGEWRDPFIHMQASPKINSFVQYLFTSSLFGEATFPAILVVLGCMIAALHGLLQLWTFAACRQNRLAKLSMVTLFGGVAALGLFLFACPMHPAMDFRFIAWTWLPGAVLCATLLETVRNRGGWPYPVALYSIFLAIAAQITFLMRWLWIPGRGYI
jgi:hypothetical protein